MISLDSIIQKIGYNPLTENRDAGLDDQPPYICQTEITIPELEFLAKEAAKKKYHPSADVW